MKKAVLALCALLLLTGCVGLDASEASHWIGQPQKIEDIIILGHIEDPATTGGELKIQSGDWGPNEVLFRTDYPRRVSVYISRPSGRLDSWLPKSGDPAGEYVFELRDVGDPRCDGYERSFKAWTDEWRPSHASHGLPRPERVVPGKCLAWRYEGALNLKKPGRFVFYHYYDESYSNRNLGLNIAEIRNADGIVVARNARCFNALGLQGTRFDFWDCKNPDNFLEDLISQPNKFGGQ